MGSASRKTIQIKESAMKYKKVIVSKRGGPEVLQVVEEDLRDPAAGEVRVKILATPVCLPDVQARYGQSPSAPKTPFVPGYTVIGIIDAIGPKKGYSNQDAADVSVGDRVAALTVYGGYAEYIILDKGQLIPVPADLDPAEAAIIILNYIVAYQTLHRSARVKAGDKVLIIGASGGIGTAFLQLGRLAGLKMYGLASANKHPILREYGAIPIDYHSQDFVEVIRHVEPNGLDAVLDGMGGDYFKRGLSVLRRGGICVEYGNPLSFPALLRLVGKTLLFNLLLNGKTAKLYGTSTSRFGRQSYMEDWAALFKLLTEGKIKPVIEHKYSILEAAQANARLESGQVIGNIVLLTPELL
jgi:NADPH:quinone reductase-like Zn-dependent oxidoreductase